jgi:hypothetical protein
MVYEYVAVLKNFISVDVHHFLVTLRVLNSLTYKRIGTAVRAVRASALRTVTGRAVPYILLLEERVPCVLLLGEPVPYVLLLGERVPYILLLGDSVPYVL